MRVQQIRNIGVLEGNEPVSANEWEKVKRGGEKSIEKWIDGAMKYKQCVIVLIGEKTSTRPWVQHEIAKAWNDGRPMFGIYIHRLRCPTGGYGRKGKNPFDEVVLEGSGEKLSKFIKCYVPDPNDAYNDIAKNMQTWIGRAVKQKKK